MLIFFGTRSSRIQSQKVTSHTVCPHCESQNSFIATIFGTYFHIFWIPMFTLGKRTIVECSHCKKTYDEKELPESIRTALHKSLQDQPPKKAYWHCSGCFIILGASGLFLLLLIYALIFKAVKEDDFVSDDSPYDYEEVYTKDQTNYKTTNAETHAYQLKKDMLNTDYSPNIEKDKYSFALKLCLDAPSFGLDESTTGYFSKVSENKLLILVEIEELDVLTEPEKNKIYSKLNMCVDDILGGNTYQTYIGTFKNKTFTMLQTPEGVFKDDQAINELLLPFYDLKED
ncbi:zinc-ribbon domain-containing protein [Psychroserpens sp. BH13MA-6]